MFLATDAHRLASTVQTQIRAMSLHSSVLGSGLPGWPGAHRARRMARPHGERKEEWVPLPSPSDYVVVNGLRLVSGIFLVGCLGACGVLAVQGASDVCIVRTGNGWWVAAVTGMRRWGGDARMPVLRSHDS